jgi:hypothetical protein
MIKAKIYFENIFNVDNLIDSLLKLPESVRPVYFTEDERKVVKENLVSNEVLFRDFKKKNQSGFFLCVGNKTFFNVSIRPGGYAEVTLYLVEGVSSEIVEVFFRCFADNKPVFGFACDYQEPIPDSKGSYVINHDSVRSEYDHRNRHYIKIGKNNIETWIGRRLERYIPGVYWYTLLSDVLLIRHSVNLDDLVAETFSAEELADGTIHLLKFFEKPEDWKKNADRLDDLCERVNGIFSRRPVEAEVSRVKSYSEYDALIAKWK